MTANWRTIEPALRPLQGRVVPPGDKSIAHRAVLFNAAAAGRARLENVPEGGDVRASIRAVAALGAKVECCGGRWTIEGRALRFKPPRGPIDCGNSGTTMRLLMGLLAGQKFEATLDGDDSLRRRPMERVAEPLRAMGADIETTRGRAPVRVCGARLHPTVAHLPVASAQVKTALLLAGLQADGRTEVHEPARSRDHSERMLAAMGVEIERRGLTVAVRGPAVPRAMDVSVPGDPSSAAFLIVAATLVPGSDLVVERVCLNPTRTGFLDVLMRMGARIETAVEGHSGGEPWGSVRARASALRAVEIEGDEIPRTIDEIPVLAVAAACAEGTTHIRDASELRVKESDRIATTARLLAALGVEVEERADGLSIAGGRLRGPARADAQGDHRIAMAAAVAGLAASGPVEIAGVEAVSVSYPNFFEHLEGLMR